MDGRERDGSQLYRSNIKRPWDEDATVSKTPNSRHDARLPPIESGRAQGMAIHSGTEQEDGSSIFSQTDSTKRRRFEGHSYDYISGETISSSTRRPGSRSSYSLHDWDRIPVDSPRQQPSQPKPNAWGRPELMESDRTADALYKSDYNTTFLCGSCRRLTTPSQNGDYVSCESCSKSPELASVTQKAAAVLTQLTETLAGLASEFRGSIHTPEHSDASSACPPISQFGVKSTLDWILERIYHANELADKIARQVPSNTLQSFRQGTPGRPSTKGGFVPQDGLSSIMKRRIGSEADDAFRFGEDLEPTSDPQFSRKRRSLKTTVEDSALVRPGNEYPPFSAIDRGSQRASVMNPPLTPNRQLPSPPGLSIHSPTSGSFPSPSTGLHENTNPPINLPPLPTIRSSSTYLPPIASAHGPDALQAHTAALQHEVSIQKIALSSLQGEHDKLLAAFSRSQTRASALEKKHAVSDTEIINLSEEKLRLQSQVIELEGDIEEVSRSRDEYRQAAVQEGAQYVQIVKKASQLEEIAAEERKEWNRLKGEMEARIESLLTEKGLPRSHSPGDTEGKLENASASLDQSTDRNPNDKPGNDSKSSSLPKDMDEERNRVLEDEIQHLRQRYTEMELILRTVQKEGQNMQRTLETLGLAGKSILEEVDKLLVTDDAT